MRGYREFKPQKQYVDLQDRILSALVYAPNWGWAVCLVWLIVTHVKGKSLSSFARFNIFQSIFISTLIFIFYFILIFLQKIFSFIASIIQPLGNFFINIIYYPFQYPISIFFNNSLFDFALILLNIYLIFYALTGRYGKVPYISDIVQKIV